MDSTPDADRKNREAFEQNSSKSRLGRGRPRFRDEERPEGSEAADDQIPSAVDDEQPSGNMRDDDEILSATDDEQLDGSMTTILSAADDGELDRSMIPILSAADDEQLDGAMTPDDKILDAMDDEQPDGSTKSNHEILDAPRDRRSTYEVFLLGQNWSRLNTFGSRYVRSAVDYCRRNRSPWAILIFLVISAFWPRGAIFKCDTESITLLPSPRECVVHIDGQPLLPAGLATPFSAMFSAIARQGASASDYYLDEDDWLQGDLPIVWPAPFGEADTPPWRSYTDIYEEDSCPHLRFHEAVHALNLAKQELRQWGMQEWRFSLHASAYQISLIAADAEARISRTSRWKLLRLFSSDRNNASAAIESLAHATRVILRFCSSSGASHDPRGPAFHQPPYKPLNVSRSVAAAHHLRSLVLDEVDRIADLEGLRVRSMFSSAPSAVSWTPPAPYTPRWAQLQVPTHSDRRVTLLGPGKIGPLTVPTNFHRRHLNGLMALYAHAEWTLLLARVLDVFNTQIEHECDSAKTQTLTTLLALLGKKRLNSTVTLNALGRMINIDRNPDKANSTVLFGLFSPNTLFIERERQEMPRGNRHHHNGSNVYLANQMWRSLWRRGEKTFIRERVAEPFHASQSEHPGQAHGIRCLTRHHHRQSLLSGEEEAAASMNSKHFSLVELSDLGRSATWLFWQTGASPAWQTRQYRDYLRSLRGSTCSAAFGLPTIWDDHKSPEAHPLSPTDEFWVRNEEYARVGGVSAVPGDFYAVGAESSTCQIETRIKAHVRDQNIWPVQIVDLNDARGSP